MRDKQVFDNGEKIAKRGRFLIIGIAIALVVAVFVSLLLGRYSLPPKILVNLIAARLSGRELDETLKSADTVLFIIRIPRILLSLMVGAALAVSGAAYQSLFRNPMVSPDILGVTQGAGAGAAAGILLSLPTVGTHLLSFVFGIAAVSLVLLISKLVGQGRSLTVLILTGMVMNFFFQSLTSFAKYIADADNKLPEITFWLMGSFARSGSYRNVWIMLGALILGGVPLLLLRWRINILSFGDEEAAAMGINVRQTRFVIIVCSTILTASAVSLCGTIGWVGLIIPHIVRLVAGPNNNSLFPASMLGGALFLLIVDNFARAIVPGELPIGILTSLIGAPLFLLILFQGRKEVV
jgi:iron complex transport system permease protein